MKRWLEIFARYDWSLLLAASSLAVIGLLAIYGISVSRGTADFFQFNKQLIAFLIGLAAALGLALVNYRHLRTLSTLFFVGGAFMLLCALIFGTTSRGAGRWFVLGTLSFQPVEIIKVVLAISLAAYLSGRVHKRLGWKTLAASAGMSFVLAGLIIAQPDFGSAMVLVAVWIATAVFCGLPRHAWWMLLLTAVTAASLLWSFGLKPYQRDRIMSYLNPSHDPYGASYNVAQARIAIGSGGLFGKGIGEGSQARLRFLPEATTDFMFAVIGEELGFAGLAVVLSLFAFLFYRLIRLGLETEDAFAGILLVSIASIMLFHLSVNAGMNLGLLPVTGIPLPFVSAAPSSLICMFVAIGLAESVAVGSKGRFK